MKKTYIKPESEVIGIQIENCMKHWSKVSVDDEEELEEEDGMPDDEGWSKDDKGWSKGWL
ncbi:MAG: hypothetical protein MRZ50_07230 [Prevotella sp.]|nr:hypothetical protein [Prevotella sp.]